MRKKYRKGERYVCGRFGQCRRRNLPGLATQISQLERPLLNPERVEPLCSNSFFFIWLNYKSMATKAAAVAVVSDNLTTLLGWHVWMNICSRISPVSILLSVSERVGFNHESKILPSCSIAIQRPSQPFRHSGSAIPMQYGLTMLSRASLQQSTLRTTALSSKTILSLIKLRSSWKISSPYLMMSMLTSRLSRRLKWKRYVPHFFVKVSSRRRGIIIFQGCQG